MDFKNTIFLPETDFQMQASLSKKEPEITEYWEKLDIYAKLRSIPKEKGVFILHDGPPFANGTPHAGTAMNKVLKDIIIRMKQMQGYDAPFVPGWDCHGLPIEWKIEEQIRESGKSKNDVPIAEFRNMCHKFAEYWIDVQRSGFKRLGVSADWKNPYLTMNFENEAEIARCMGKFIVDGTLYRGERPVYWSVVEETALADAEIEYMDKKSASLYVAFEIKSTDVDFLKDSYCIIWTTTPWSIPGNRVVAFREDIEYCLIEANDRKFIVATDLINDFSETTGVKCKTIKTFSGKVLEGAICRPPLHKSGYDFDVPMLHGEHVKTDSGTGLVHTAPEHGVEDFVLCKKHMIPQPHTVGGNGLYYDHVPLFAGKHVFKVENDIIAALSEAQALIFSGTIKHSYPHSWRSKAPLIFRTTPQWFISMDKTNLRKKALAEIEKAKWIPAHGYNRIKSFVENRGDWCVSRQRVWGVPIPLFICKKSGEPLRDENVMNCIVEIFKKEGTNAWFSRKPQDFLGDKYSADDYEQNMDTMDVWFESASSHSYVIRKGNGNIQSDLYLEGSDQHRGWFQHSLLSSCGIYDNSPFKAVLTHGFIIDEKGRKMSKSIGNVVTLDDVVNNWGADIFRMWVSNSDYTQDLKLGINILKQLEDVYRKLRNTLRYMLGALSGYGNDEENVKYQDLPSLEKWILHKLAKTEASLDECIDNYDINKYFMTLYTFCAVDLSSFFFDIRKDCLYCDHENSQKRRAYRSILHVLFQHLVRRMAPIMVFTSEEAWLSFYGKGSVHLEEFMKPNTEWINDELFEKINKVKEIRKSVTTALEIARKNKVIGSSLQASVTLYDPDGIITEKCENFWEEIAITSGFEIQNSAIPATAFVGDDIKNIGVVVSTAAGEKCERCWKICHLENHLCKRCQEVLAQKK
jgi:isoleucyl-tRNA synthetase